MKKLLIGIAGLLLLVFLPLAYFDLVPQGPSRCYGGTANGRLEGARRPPLSGANYRSYCRPCVLALRTFGHEKAVAALVETYRRLAESRPETRFVYGEIGWPWGGRFRPHRTHRNGLSVDFMVPLADGRELPTHAFNRFGYDAEFDASGRGPAGEIDFDAIAAHLLALEEAAQAHGGGLARVILAPDLQDDLFATNAGAALRSRLHFNARPAWVRHDDHYHVDFAFPCAG